MKTFYESLSQDRKAFSKKVAMDKALDAHENHLEMLRTLNREIRDIKRGLEALNDDAWTDEFVIALKKGDKTNIMKDVNERRHELRLDLRDKLIERDILKSDNFYDIPDELKSEEITELEKSVLMNNDLELNETLDEKES